MSSIAELEEKLRADPENAPLLKELGNARKAAGDAEGAIASYRRSLAVSPDYLPALYNLGLALHEAVRLEEAERCFGRIRELDPQDADALFHLGAVLASRRRPAEAADAYRQALRAAPGNAYLWMHLGVICRELPGGMEESARSLRRALELEPGLGEAREALANMLADEGRLDEALGHYREAIRLAPMAAAAHNGLGAALVRKGELEEGARCFRRAIELQPDFADAHFNLGCVHTVKARPDEARRCYRAAHELQPGDPLFTANLLHEMQNLCDWADFQPLCRQLRSSLPGPVDRAVNPFGLLSIPSTLQEQLDCARNYAARQAHAVRRDAERAQFKFARGARSRLKIGYLSADFHQHATAYLTAELYELHDRSRFEIFGYSYGPDDRSPMRRRLAAAFDRFVDLAPHSHLDAAAAIHRDRIDILVDLKGYTTDARTEIMALRPAPVQVNYLGYPGSMGAAYVDYLVADEFLVPPALEAGYSEKLVFMPGSYQVNDRKRRIGDTPARPLLGLPEDGFVFCCFNQTYKIMPEVFALWMRLLAAVPRSVLWLLQWNPTAMANLRREAQAAGVDAGRLIFAPPLPLEPHLGRVRAADLFLDTLPYNAHTTASDALWAGVPLVTCAGETFASRVAGSLLAAAGMRELITRSLPDYEALALRLARAPQELARVRAQLSASRSEAVLFDTTAFTRALEAAYERMWDNYVGYGEARAIPRGALTGAEAR